MAIEHIRARIPNAAAEIFEMGEIAFADGVPGLYPIEF
jgi:hypothetical protein